MDADRLRETVDTLDGTRGDRRRAAVRLADLQGLLELPARLQSAKAAGAAPTKAEYDALVADVTLLHLRLSAVMQALTDRLK